MLGVQGRWSHAGTRLEVDGFVGSRFTSAEFAPLEPHLAGTAAIARLTVSVRERLFVAWSYNDFGERVTGKVAMRFQPSRRVIFRGAVGTGFRAPGLSQVAFNKVVTNVIADEFVEVGIFPVDDPAALALGAQPLKEETSINLSAGLAFTPVDNLTVTADVFHIDIDDRIILGATFDDDATLALLAGAGVTGIGGVQYFTNGVDTRTQGLDITGNYRVPTGERGTLDLTASLNYTHNEIRHVDSIPQVLRDAGSTEPGLLYTVTVIAIEFAFLIGGLVVTEQVFNLNGLGLLFVQAVAHRDYTLIQALVMLVAGIFIFMNFLLDAAFAWLDPRVRYS